MGHQADYRIECVTVREWNTWLDGALIGTSRSANEAARLLEQAVQKRLPPYWSLQIWNAGQPDFETLGMEFDGSTVQTAIEDLPRTVHAHVEFAWRQFLTVHPEWAWLRSHVW